MDNEALKPILAGMVRHGLTSLGGALVAGGYMQSSDTSAFIGGGMVIAGIAWSWWQKEGQEKFIAILAKMKPVAGPNATKAEAVKAAKDAVKDAAKSAAIVIAILLAGLMLLPGESFAQVKLKPLTGNIGADTKCKLIWDPMKLCGALTGKPEEDMQRVVKRIQSIGRDDMNYAILKATAAGTNGAKVRLQCLQAIMDAKNAAEGVNIKDANGNVVPRPDPAFVTTIEDVAELIDGLSPTGPLMTGCAGAAQLFKTNTLAAINAIVTGAASIAALPAGL